MSQFYPPNGLRVCIDHKEESDIEGRIYTPLFENVIEFQDLTQFILKIDMLFDKYNYPKAYQEKRSFHKNQSIQLDNYKYVKREAKDIIDQCGTIKTYDIIVSSRQHSSWQGIIKDENGNIIYYYESVLELMNFLCKKDQM